MTHCKTKNHVHVLGMGINKGTFQLYITQCNTKSAAVPWLLAARKNKFSHALKAYYQIPSIPESMLPKV